MICKRKIAVLAGLLVAGLAGIAVAGTVLEARFDNEQDLAAGASVTLDKAAAGASRELTVQSATKVSAGATGLGEKWKPFLAKGYVDIGAGSGTASREKFGLVSKDTGKNAAWRNYLGFSGLGSAEKQTGGTLYLVVQPNGEWKDEKVKRRVLFGTGYAPGKNVSPGALRLWIQGGKLSFEAGRGESPTQAGHTAPAADLNGDKDQDDFVSAVSTVTQDWSPKKWYFVAASWQGGAAPVLVVREMAAEGGAAASPAAVVGTAQPVANNVVAAVPVDSAAPRGEPIVIGAVWADFGQGHAEDGADAKIAYVRLDNTFAAAQQIDAVFAGLDAATPEAAAPEPAPAPAPKAAAKAEGKPKPAAKVAAPSITIPTGVRSNLWEPGQPVKLEATLNDLPADAKGTVTVVNYDGKEVLKKDVAAADNKLPIDLGTLPAGYYEATVTIGDVSKKATLGVTPFVHRTAAEVRDGGYRFGLKKYNLDPKKPNTYNVETAVATCCDLGLQWTREMLQSKTNLGTIEMVNKYPMNVVMKVERFPKELYDEARYGPLADWEKKFGKGVWTLKTLPKEAEYKKWLRSEIDQIPPEQKVFEVWNEAWDKMNPEDFGTLCQWISETILAARPDAIIGPNLQGQMSVYEWDARVIKAGGMKGMKMVALHPYATSEDRAFIRKYRQWVSEQAGHPIDIYVTEFGSHSTPQGPAARSEKDQAQRVVRQALSLYVEDVKAFMPHWMGQTENNPTYIEDWFGFFRLSGQPKPVLIAYAAAARMVDGSKYVGDLWLGPECDAMLFNRNGVYTLAIGTHGDAKQVEVPVGVAEVMQVDMVGAEKKVKSTDGKLKVDAGGDWVYLVGVSPDLVKQASTDLREDRWPKPAKPPRITRTAHKLAGQFVADGKLDEWKGALQLAQQNPKVAGDDASGFSYLAWDEQNLYFALDMRDNELLNKQPRPKLYRQDSIELFVSTEPRDQNSGYGKHDFQLFIAPTSGEDKPIAAVLTDREQGTMADLKDAKFYAGKKPAGWIVEIAIPWSTFGDFKPKAGSKIALEVRVNDADTSHERWKLDPVDNQTYRPEDPTGWSYLMLEE